MKRRKRDTPLMLFWSRQDQRRFIDAVERFVCAVNDMDRMLLKEQERRSAAARKAAQTRKASAEPQGATGMVDALTRSLEQAGADGAVGAEGGAG